MLKFILVLAIGLCLCPPLWAQSEGLPSPNRLRAPVSGCPVCDLWLKYEDVFLRAKLEVGRLENGVFYFHHSEDPDVIEPLIRFAHERESLSQALGEDRSLQIRLGRACGHDKNNSADIELEISTSARGALALLRSTSRNILVELRKDAERAILGKVPAWY